MSWFILFRHKAMMSSGKRSTGPRAILKTQKCREIAQLKMQREREEVREKQNDSPYEKFESTAQSSQALAVKRLVRPSCLDVTSEKDLTKLADEKGNNQNEAVTYWSHELIAGNKPHFPVTPLNRGSLFARCTSFSNDIEDSRLRHNEADEFVS
mmetsp:Transcript_11008/g.20175  ORF Transcript_11008/g.20175 Transcript_11008/m.20175 type:complete len:154 (-) Transcript_11008:80-541(-)